MSGAKINQLKSAMDVIFQQLNANDAFQVIDCGTQVQVSIESGMFQQFFS